MSVFVQLSCENVSFTGLTDDALKCELKNILNNTHKDSELIS